MVWCAGYLSNPALVNFLRRAKGQLRTQPGTTTRTSEPTSFIFIFDNVLEEGDEKEPEKGQRFRTAKQFEAIFAEAGLLTHKHVGPEPMPGDYMNVKVWALY